MCMCGVYVIGCVVCYKKYYYFMYIYTSKVYRVQYGVWCIHISIDHTLSLCIYFYVCTLLAKCKHANTPAHAYTYHISVYTYTYTCIQVEDLARLSLRRPVRVKTSLAPSAIAPRLIQGTHVFVYGIHIIQLLHSYFIDHTALSCLCILCTYHIDLHCILYIYIHLLLYM